MAMPVLPNAHHFTIGTFNVDAGTHTHNHVHHGQGSRPPQGPRDYLYSNIAAGAIHDSAERYEAPSCLEETREAVQADIISWMTDDRDDAEPKSILWLTGPAGAGKSAIAGTIAENCQDKDLLAASFFFSSYTGSERRRYKRYLVPTLAYQIAQLPGYEGYQDTLSACIQRDPAIFTRRLKTQMEALILLPLRTVHSACTLPTGTRTVIVDGVDEVEAEGSRQLPPLEARDVNERDQGEVISALLQAANDKHFPFRIFIASRPERIIRDTLSSGPVPLTELFLDDKYDPDSDIALFLRCKFSEIRRRYQLPTPWPSDEDIKSLVHTASGQFIYASTVIRCVQDRTAAPTERLNALLRLTPFQRREPHPLASLYQLYHHVLQSSPDPTLSAFWLLSFQGLFQSKSPALFARQLLEDTPGQAQYLLENLTSLVYIPDSVDEVSPYRLYHRSLVEYLRGCVEASSNMYLKRACWMYFDRRINTILLSKHPAVPLIERCRCDFIAHLSGRITSFLQRCCMGYSVSPDNLLACDVNWWLCAIAHVVPDQLAFEMPSFFEAVHYGWAIHYWTPSRSSDCPAVCRHWRGSIIKFCRRNGWTVPNATALLRERMCFDFRDKLKTDDSQSGGRDDGRDKNADEDGDEDKRKDRVEGVDIKFRTTDDEEASGTHATSLLYSRLSGKFSGRFPFDPYFRPPAGFGEHPISSHAASGERDDLEDYDVLLRRVQTMFEQLPHDWFIRYAEELLTGATVYSALEEEISRISSRFPELL